MSNMACISKKTKSEPYGFQTVPESLDAITNDWCERALKTGVSTPVIAEDVNVTSIDIKRLQNEISGVMDGGGFSGSTLVRIKVDYGGNVRGNEPSSLIGKISLGSDIKWNLFWRFAMYSSMGGGLTKFFSGERFGL